MWPDLAKFLQFGKTLKPFGILSRVCLVFGKLKNLLWQIFNAIGQIFLAVDDQILNRSSSHLVALNYNCQIISCCFSSSLQTIRQTSTTGGRRSDACPVQQALATVSRVDAKFWKQTQRDGVDTGDDDDDDDILVFNPSCRHQLTLFHATDWQDWQTGFHSIHFSAQWRLVWNTNCLQTWKQIPVNDKSTTQKLKKY